MPIGSGNTQTRKTARNLFGDTLPLPLSISLSLSLSPSLSGQTGKVSQVLLPASGTSASPISTLFAVTSLTEESVEKCREHFGCSCSSLRRRGVTRKAQPTTSRSSAPLPSKFDKFASHGGFWQPAVCVRNTNIPHTDLEMATNPRERRHISKCRGPELAQTSKPLNLNDCSLDVG